MFNMYLGLAIPFSAVAIFFFTGGVIYIFCVKKTQFVSVVKIILKPLHE